MLLTIVYGEQVTCIEISPDMELENFVGLCLIEIPALVTVPPADIRLVFNGATIGLSVMTMPKPIKEFGLSDGDAVSIEQVPPQQSQHQGSTVQSQPSSASFSKPDITSLVSNLVRGIKLPNSHSSVQRDKRKARNIFDSLKILLILMVSVLTLLNWLLPTKEIQQISRRFSKPI
uniref:Ubiquitin-like domain-containing protein n=1 Tax=Ditylenchus dipsaci TaxID=166011 RepID=A0A915EQ77_9BILA